MDQTSVAGYRLPTDTEWEYAARGGLTSKRYPWGNTISHDQANYNSLDDSSYDTNPTLGHHPMYNDGTTPYTSPVGSFSANVYGLYDMAGNVGEWCFDRHPLWQGRPPVVRGGGWDHSARSCRAGEYTALWPNSPYFSIGFRTALSPADTQ